MPRRSGFAAYVDKLLEIIDSERPRNLSVEEVSLRLGISPNYARAVMKAVARKRGYLLSYGVLYVRKEEERDE